MTARRYRDVAQNEDGWSDWWAPVPEGYRIACCTCGLVHLVDHRKRAGQIEWRFKIERRATAAVRRGKRHAKIREALRARR